MNPEPPTTKPELALNRSGPRSQPHPHATVAEALNDFITFAATGLTGQTSLAIATAYFDAGGFAQIADSLNLVDHVRLLLGAEPHPPTRRPRSLDPNTNSIDKSNHQQLSRALQNNQQSIRWSRDLLEFTPEICHTVQQLLDWLESGKVQVRRLEDKFLHAKAFIVEQNQHGAIAGSSNFTRAGLTRNIELNLGNYTPSTVAQVSEFFNDLWDRAKEYDLAKIFELAEPHPYLIYLRMLWERYRHDLDAEEEQPIQLAQFQQHGLMRAQRIMEKYGGVLIADEVGLGKTYIAGELIRLTEQNKQQALVVAPAVLRDGMWEGFLERANFRRRSVRVMSYDDVVSHMLGDKRTPGFDPEDIAMVVADEAHYLRNPSTQRAEAFNELMRRGEGRKKLVLMTATPVNNKLSDLFVLFDNILRAGGHGDAALGEIGVPSLWMHFQDAEAQDIDKLEPKHLFNAIDELSVRRMRQFIKKHYSDNTYEINGQEQRISFPKANVQALHYNIDQLLPDFFDRFAVALNVEGNLDAEKNQKVLTLARYTPSRYLKNPDLEEADLRELGAKRYEIMLSGLMRSLLLKRFESSPYAFGISCERMIESNSTFLQLLAAGNVVSKQLLAEIVDSGSDDAERVLEDKKDKRQGMLFDEEIMSASEYDDEKLREHIERDNEILGEFADLALAVKREDDPTLEVLVGCLEDIVERAGKSVDDRDSRDRRKVLIFSYYADTVDWIFEHLENKVAETNSQLACYAGRIAKLDGSGANRKSQVLQGFAPRTVNPGLEPSDGDDKDDLYDIVVATDVLAEGVNLQQAQNIINYDLPWNPMRLVQRHGRIDRIGSPHKEVYLHCIMPAARLERLLKLEETLRLKIAKANAAVGVGKTLPEQEQAIERNFADAREELEKIEQGNTELFEGMGSGAVAMSGEEFRQELREAIAGGKGGEIEGLPWRSGTGMALGSSTEVGADAEPGFVFCAQVGDSRNIQYRFVPLWLAKGGGVGSEPTGQIDVVDQSAAAGRGTTGNETPTWIVSDTLECLLLARPNDGWDALAVPQNLVQPERHPIFSAWELARDHIVEEWKKNNKRTVEPEIPRVLNSAGQLLDDNRPPGMPQKEIDKAIETIQAPLLETDKRVIAKIMREFKDDKPKAVQEIMVAIKKLGLKPYQPPLANPEITREDVHLICWLALV